MIRIPDYALVRYLERAHGLDVAAVRAEIAAQVVRCADAAETVNRGRVGTVTVIGQEHRFILRDGLVIRVEAP